MRHEETGRTLLTFPFAGANKPTLQPRRSSSGWASQNVFKTFTFWLRLFGFVASLQEEVMRKKLMRLVRLTPIALLVAAGVAAAQTNQTASATGIVTGVVTDASTGKPVAGAVVIGTSPAVKGEQTSVTDASGKFTISSLPAGTYKLSVQLGGFKPGERADLVVKADTTLRANVTVVPEAVQMEEVVVTGSRVRRKDLTSDSPVTVISSQVIMDSGRVTIGAFLATLPETGNALNAQFNNGGTGATNISLRGLGANRTLVLVDGKRFPGVNDGTNNDVDLNAIPTFAVDRIEILKDGGSAIYGSDAIAGVVNIITKKSLNGANGQIYYGISNYGDGNTLDINVTGGVQAEKGSAVFAAGYFNQAEVMSGNRGWQSKVYALDYTTGNNRVFNGSSAIPAGRFTLDPWTCDTPACLVLRGKSRSDQGARAWAADSPANGYAHVYNSLPVKDTYNFGPVNYLYTPSERVTAFSNGNYKLSDNVRFFYQSSFQNRLSAQQLAPNPVFLINIDPAPVYSKDSVYNPYGQDLFDVRKRMSDFGPRAQTQDINTFNQVVGLDGTLPDDAGFFKGWFWSGLVNYGRSSGISSIAGTFRAPNLENAIGPSMMINGVPRCVRTPGDASTVILGCVPLNMIGGPGSAVGQEGNLGYRGNDYSWLQMVNVDLNFSGTIAKLPWADVPMGLAVGYQYRNNSGAFIPDPIRQAGESDGNNAKATSGGYFTNEAYAELNVPVVTGVPGIEDLEAIAAVRYVNYSTFGSNWSWKVGGRYKPVRDFALRGTYTTAFRAPTITELYQGAADNFPSASDPCAGPNIPADSALGRQCRSEGPNVLNNASDLTQLKSINGGNKNLTPETAVTWTAGFVFEPGFLKGFALTTDYYAIDITNTISTLGVDFILSSCYPASGSTNTPKYCDLVQRDQRTGTIARIIDTNINVGAVKTAGIDASINYKLPNFAAGLFQLMFNLAWVQYWDETKPDGTVIKWNGTYSGASGSGSAYPEWRFNAGVLWNLDAWGAGVNTRFVGSMKECGVSSGLSGAGICSTDSTYSRKISANNEWDMFLAYTLKSAYGSTNFSFGVNNVFNNIPPTIYNNSTYGSAPATYDFMGRFFYFKLGQSI
jgi:iron complex outermembrane receptor protein